MFAWLCVYTVVGVCVCVCVCMRVTDLSIAPFSSSTRSGRCSTSHSSKGTILTTSAKTTTAWYVRIAQYGWWWFDDINEYFQCIRTIVTVNTPILAHVLLCLLGPKRELMMALAVIFVSSIVVNNVSELVKYTIWWSYWYFIYHDYYYDYYHYY
jgi:hypothetical protein